MSCRGFLPLAIIIREVLSIWLTYRSFEPLFFPPRILISFPEDEQDASSFGRMKVDAWAKGRFDDSDPSARRARYTFALRLESNRLRGISFKYFYRLHK